MQNVYKKQIKNLFVAFVALVVIIMNIILQLVIKFGNDDEPVQDSTPSLADTINNNFNTITMNQQIQFFLEMS